MSFNRLDFLLKEIEDVYVQENFYKLKLYLEQLTSGDSTLIQNIVNAASTDDNQISKVMSCDASVGVGNWVVNSLVTNNTVEAAADNLTPEPVIGIVLDKPATTKCNVCFVGLVPITLARGRVYLSQTGQASITGPSVGYQQKLGVSFGDNTMFVNPESTRIKRI